MPNVQTELDKLKGKRLFTKFDVRVGYNNIRIEDDDTYKAAFKTPLGTYVPKVMPFGLTNAPSVFQCTMYQDMHPLLLKYPQHVANLMDDWAIATENTPEGQALHEEIVHAFLDLLQTHSYFLKASKCVFEADYVDFLSFQIHAGCAQIDPIKLDGIAQWPEELTNKKQICQLLGVTGYQRPFIVNYAKLVLPLTKLLKNETPFKWMDEQREAVQALKQAIACNPRLHPLDLMKQFELHTNVSAYALGATLFQQDECGKKLMIGTASRKLTETERNYDV
jgi:hypothetical protein